MEEDMATSKCKCRTHYSLEELKTCWDQYCYKTGFRYLVNGHWQYDFSGNPIGHIAATRAEIALMRNHMTFPEFLEKYGKKENT